MRRIKGRYKQTDIVRWLDPCSGYVYQAECSRQPRARNFEMLPDGTWIAAHNGCVWVPDEPVITDLSWVVLVTSPEEMFQGRTRPAMTIAVTGFTESAARAEAERRVDKSKGHVTCAVVQIQPGNTVTFVPPTPPKPEVLWT